MSVCKVAPADDVPSKMASCRFRFPLLCDSSRFVVLVLCMLCMTAISANSLLLNFTVICMTPDANFTSSQKGWLLAGTAIGGIAAIGPVPPLISMLGLRLVFSTFGILSGLATALVPVLFSMGGFWALFVIRILQGACLMPAMPAMSQITHHWANSAKREHALFLTLLSLYMQLGVIFTMPITGWLCESAWGWHSAYYLFGLLSLLFFAAFFVLYRNSPAQSPFVSSKESDALMAANQQGQQQMERHRERVPYWRMLNDWSVWSCLASGTGFGLAYWIFAQYGPTYMHEVLDFKVNSTGIWVAVPYFFAIFSKLLVPLLERVQCIPLRLRIVWFPFICQLVDVGCFALLGFCPTASPVLAQAAIIVVLCANGAGFVALASNCQVIGRQHAHFILAMYALVNYVITLVQPLVIAWVAASKERAELATQWSRIFFVYGALLFLLNFLFAIGARTRPRRWTGFVDQSTTFVVAEGQSPWAVGSLDGANKEDRKEDNFLDRF